MALLMLRGIGIIGKGVKKSPGKEEEKEPEKLRGPEKV